MESWTANQVTAFNLKRARDLRGLTQGEAAAKIKEYLGEEWSIATFSAAERSVRGDRIRQFRADELVAFAQAFDLPVSYFLTPPHDRMMKADHPESRGINPLVALDVVHGTEAGQAELGPRIQAILNASGGEMTPSQQREFSRWSTVTVGGVVQALNNLEQWSISLKWLSALAPELLAAVEAELNKYPRVPEEERSDPPPEPPTPSANDSNGEPPEGGNE